MARRTRAEPGSRLARLRQEAHRALDVHWELGGASRSGAYAWLAEQLGMSRQDCHIGMFDEEQCERAIEVCRASSPPAR